MYSKADKGKARARSSSPSLPASTKFKAVKEPKEGTTSPYPPGVREIIERKHRRERNGHIGETCGFDGDLNGILTTHFRKWSWEFATSELCIPGPSTSRRSTESEADDTTENLTQTVTLSPRTLRPSEPALEAAFAEMTTCDEAIRWVKNTNQSLVQIRDGMWRTLCEYFSKFWIYIFEVPAYPRLRKVINRLIEHLAVVESKLADMCYLQRDSVAFKMMQDIESGLRWVINEGLEILKFWNHREKSQKLGSPLSKKDRRMRSIAIHDSNDRVKKLREHAKAAEKTILDQRLLRDTLRKQSLVMYIRMSLR